MQAKFLAAAVLLMAAMTCAQEVTEQPTAFAALQVTANVSQFWESMAQFTDVAELVGDDFSGTIFAPDNTAWAALVEELHAAGIPLTTSRLKDIILYSIIPGPPAPIAGLNDDQIFVSSLGDKTISAQYTDGKLSLNGVGSSAGVVTPDIWVGAAHYGVVHVIDNVLLPFELPKPTEPLDSVHSASLTEGSVGAKDVTTDLTNAANTAQQAIGSAVGSVANATKNAKDAIATAVNQATNTASSVGGTAAAGVAAGVAGAGALASNAADTAVNATVGAVNAVTGAATGTGGSAGGDPAACPLIMLPVCGGDGKTYDNECVAKAAGTTVASQGPCSAPMEGGPMDMPGMEMGPSAAPSPAPATSYPSPMPVPEPSPVPPSAASSTLASAAALAGALLAAALLI